MHQMIRDYGLVKVHFNGCQLGLRSNRGQAICKPWTFATNIPTVVEMFSSLKCTRDHEHAVCSGDELRRTESYTPQTCTLLHLCINDFVLNPISVACPGSGDDVPMTGGSSSSTSGPAFSPPV